MPRRVPLRRVGIGVGLRPQNFARQEFRAIQAELSRVISSIGKVSEDALMDAAEFIKEKAVEKTPVKTGQLRDSAFAGVASTRTGKKFVKVGFSDPKAIFVHERLDQHHDVGEAKFLENAIKQNINTIAGILAQGLDDVD